MRFPRLYLEIIKFENLLTQLKELNIAESGKFKTQISEDLAIEPRKLHIETSLKIFSKLLTSAQKSAIVF